MIQQDLQYKKSIQEIRLVNQLDRMEYKDT